MTQIYVVYARSALDITGAQALGEGGALSQPVRHALAAARLPSVMNESGVCIVVIATSCTRESLITSARRALCAGGVSVQSYAPAPHSTHAHFAAHLSPLGPRRPLPSCLCVMFAADVRTHPQIPAHSHFSRAIS